MQVDTLTRLHDSDPPGVGVAHELLIHRLVEVDDGGDVVPVIAMPVGALSELLHTEHHDLALKSI